MIYNETKNKTHMTHHTTGTSLLGKARAAGFLYLLLALLGAFGIIYVPATLIVPGNIATTVSNIRANELLFRLGIVSALAVQLINIGLVLYLYELLKSVHRHLATLTVILSLIGVPITMLNELNQFGVLLLLNDAHYTTQTQTMVSLFLELHDHGIVIAQIFWGLWLLPLGYLVLKSGYIPGFLGMLLIIGGFGYLLDSATSILFPKFMVTFSEFTFVGEILFPLWLLTKGINRSTRELEQRVGSLNAYYQTKL